MKSIFQVLKEADRGNLLPDAEAQLAAMVTAVNEGGGAASMTIKLTVKRQGDAFLVASEVKSVLPKPRRIDALFFLDEDTGDLTRRDPRQPVLSSVVDADELNARRAALGAE